MPSAHQKIYFCHGVPGHSGDLDLCPNIAASNDALAPNLLDTDGDPMTMACAAFDQHTAGSAPRSIHVVGFSIGAMAALFIAAKFPDRIGRVTLVSPAAPLQLGTFLDDMAGKPLFEMAIRRPRLLRVVTSLQGVVVRYAPKVMIRSLFANSADAERALVDDREFCQKITAGLRNSYIQNPDTYTKILRAYVADWRGTLDGVTSEVDIWHGAQDTWAPLEMSHALSAAIAGPTTLTVLEDGGHYSTLRDTVLRPIVAS